MIKRRRSSNEVSRLVALEQYSTLKTDPEEPFDGLTCLAALLCETSIAFINLLDPPRQWFESTLGWEGVEVSPPLCFCSQTLRNSTLFIVPDVALDQRFASDPQVVAAKIRFYAGVALNDLKGVRLGTLCVMDRQPRQLTLAQQQGLQLLGHQVVAHLESQRNSKQGLGNWAQAAADPAAPELQQFWQETEQRYRWLAELAPEAVLIHIQGEIVYVNPAGLRLHGAASAEELLGKKVWDIIHPASQPKLKQQIERSDTEHRPRQLQEIKILRLDGQIVEVETIGMSITYQGRPARQVLAWDITTRKQAQAALLRAEVAERTNQHLRSEIAERQRAEEQLLHKALHDPLTGLPNRILFMERLTHVMEVFKRRSDYLYAVLFLDLDHFKRVNDRLGHLKGDQLLIAIARRLESHLRLSDTVARLGGDEFAILLENVQGIHEVTSIAERIQTDVAAPYSLDGHEVCTTVSMGIAFGSDELEQPTSLLHNADVALYQAKARGKACHMVFSN